MAISQRHLKSELKIHCLVPEMKFKLTSFKHLHTTCTAVCCVIEVYDMCC